MRAIDADRLLEERRIQTYYHLPNGDTAIPLIDIKNAPTIEPSAQPEPAIPLQWIEAQIEWLKSLDNTFSTLTAVWISAMVNKWKEEQDERYDLQTGCD